MEWFNFRSIIKKISIGLFCVYASLSYIEAANKIMPLGDSITKGYITGVNPADEWGYRGLLWTKLREAGQTVSFVGDYFSGENYISTDPTFESSHSGVNGHTTADVLANINTYLTNNDPNVVLLHIGTNDVKDGVAISTAVTDVNTTIQNIYDYNSSIKVVLARIINLKSDANATLRSNVTAYNDALETMANTRIANGDNLQIVNMESGAGIDYATDMESNYHPNQSGYDLMANHWYAALNGEVHHWALDETSGTTFLDAMGSADGTCTGNCPVPSLGIKEGAQLFDGIADGLDITETATFDVPADANFTIELWAKTTDSGAIKVMIGRDDGTTTSLHWWIGMEGTGEALFTLQDRDGTGAGYPTIKSTTPINDGEWHHIAAVRDGSTGDTILYVDGSAEASHNFTSTGGFAASTPVTIGYFINNSTPGFYFDGALDEIYVHNRVLSATEIQAHYNDSAMQITTLPVTFAEVGVPYYYDVNTSKDPVDYFDWTIAKPASWMSINVDGEVTGTPDSVANLDVNITAAKGIETATQNYILKVRDRSLLPDDMAHYWKLNEGNETTIYLDSYSAVDATCTGSACPISTTGQVANAQLFNGTEDGLNVLDASTFDVPADANFTIELWAKTNNTSLQVMIGRDDGTTTSLHWWIGVDSDGTALFTLLDQNNVGAPYGTIKGTTAINDGGWHHIAAVRDGSTGDTILYVDGSAEASHNFTSTVGFAASTPVTIGYFINNSTPGFYFDGALDEIAVYGSALSSLEITQHYQNSLAGNESEVLGDTTAPVITITGNTNVDVEVDTTYSDAGATATDNLDGDITGSINTINLVNTAVLGTYSVNYSVSDRAGNSAVASRTVNVVDTQAPVITLNGDTNITIEVGTAYSELGATATDNYDGNLTTSIEINASSVDTNTVGVYTVIYDVNDSSGNVAEVTRTVNVVDTQAPVIILNGDANITLGLGSIYIDAGATATDNEDGNLTGSIVTVNPVDTNTVGVYTVTYDVNDSSGNAAAQVSRTVNVVGWFTVTSDSNSSLYTVGDTSVELDPTLFNITVGNDKIVFEEIGSEPKVYIELMSDGTVVTGYRQGTGDDPTVTGEFAPGTKVSVDADMMLLIETPLITNLTLGGTL